MTESLPSVSKLASLPDEEAATRTSKALYRAALGPVNASHYLALFERFDANGRAGLVWNPAAAFFTPGWLVFRRLWGLALGYAALLFVLWLLLPALSAQLASWPPGVVAGLLGSLVLLLVVVPGLTGNAILHAHTRQRVARAKAGAPSLGDACIALAEDAPSWNSLKAVLIGGGVVALGLVAALLLSPGSQAPRGEGAPDTAGIGAKASPPAEATATPAAAPVPAPAPVVAKKSEEPPVETVPAVSQTAALPAQPEPVATAPSAAAVAPLVEAKPVVKPVAQKSKPKPEPKPEPKPKPKPKPQTTAEPARGTYAINVGVFADAANAERAMAKLKAARLAAYTQQIEGAKGPLTRVRVGPFADGEQAAAAAQRIRALGLEALVFRP